MEKILIEGGCCLKGTIRVSGSKNAALPMLISSLLADGESIFFNVPRLGDVFTTLSLLVELGASVEFEGNTVKINSSGLHKYKALCSLVSEIRGSILILGPLIARFGKAIVSLPGGCSIGARPVNLHIKALKKLGVKVSIVDGNIMARATGRKLKGARIHFEVPTVTGTENLIMASVLADGNTLLSNAACEPEIIALSQGLNNMGAKIVGAGTSKIFITGVKKLYPANHSIIPDRIEAATFMIASVLTRGEIYMLNCLPHNLKIVIDKLRLIGANIEILGDDLHIKAGERINGLNLKTGPYPELPTDMQPLFTTLLSLSRGVSVISETIFENRFIHVKELNRMGANILVRGDIAFIKGVESLCGSQVKAYELRGSAALVLAGLAALGKTEIIGIKHLERGYENIEYKIKSLGGKIDKV